MSTPTTEELIDRYGEPDDIAQDPNGATNFDRVQWALSTISVFAELTHNVVVDGNHIRLDELSEEWAEELIGDLICDLLHLGVYVGCDADLLVEKALLHFTAEVGVGYG